MNGLLASAILSIKAPVCEGERIDSEVSEHRETPNDGRANQAFSHKARVHPCAHGEARISRPGFGP
jgi:hypothetical protein